VSSLWLMYHDVYDRAPRPDVPASAAEYHVSRESFAAHLLAIERSGHRVVTVGEYVAAPEVPGHSVVLTFDDGWSGTFELALPLLVERGWRATAFVTRDFVGRRHFAGRDTLRAAAAAGLEIGVHGVTHRMLSACTRAEIVAEFRDCRDYLEALLGHPVTHASIPGGDMTPVVVSCAREAGITSLSNSRPGVNCAASSSFDLRRLAIRATTRVVDVERYCRFSLIPERARWAALQMPRAVLGMKRYSRLRRAILRERSSNAEGVFEP
jgi:peptidoglycan/xylan/chitin deacetylase (PgdA/CDA1 family)